MRIKAGGPLPVFEPSDQIKQIFQTLEFNQIDMYRYYKYILIINRLTKCNKILILISISLLYLSQWNSNIDLIYIDPLCLLRTYSSGVSDVA